MLRAYEVAADAFTSTPEERAAEPESWWVKRQGRAGRRLDSRQPSSQRSMQRLLVLAIIASLGWYAYGKYQARHVSEPADEDISAGAMSHASPPLPTRSHRCDGRMYCSQMTSCEEATYFLNNCPGTKMDGNGDGIPCERQWCR
jgi:hypothetical protein